MWISQIKMKEKKYSEYILKKEENIIKNIGLKKIAGETEGFCGADIENVIKIAVEKCFLSEDENKKINTEDLLEIIKQTDSMKSILSEKIDALKKAYEKFKLKPASLKEGEKMSINKIGKKIVSENENMIFVQGGKYIPSFFPEERKVLDLFVSKYQITQEEWMKYMPTNPSKFKGERKPVESVTWIETLEFCNKMSEYCGLKPVYKIKNNKLEKIVYKNGKEVTPDLADFEKTEGYRLPTELEWEWFAKGGEIAIQNGTFDDLYSGGKNIQRVAWYNENSKGQTHTVGSKSK